MAPLIDADLKVEPEFLPQALLEWHQFESKKSSSKNKSELTLRAKKHLSYLGWIFKFAQKKTRNELRYISPEGKIFNSLRLACEYCMENQEYDIEVPPLEYMITEEPVSNGIKRGRGRPRKYPCDAQKQKRGKKLLSIPVSNQAIYNGKKRGHKRKSSPCDDQKQKKEKNNQAIENRESSEATNISQLIESKIVSENAEVHYIDADAPLKRGSITREGNIWCDCCNKKFDVKSFEAHSGGAFRKPALCIFLEEGRSLLNFDNNKSDDLCSICHEGGDILLCDQCPSVFHKNCVGLEKTPDGKWFCPSCTCGICGKSEFNKNKEEFTENSSSVCDQCEHEFHVGCLRREGYKKLKACSKGNWFCSNNCEKIFMGLQKILGKSIPIENSDDDDNLFWKILRYNSKELDSESMMEFHAKLNIGLAIMHGSFEPIHEAFTDSDLIEDVIFSRGSKLNRLNFRGFYTVLLEREDDVICVATLRIHGEKVAEVPLIATHPTNLRQGMCRRLMEAIEKKLVEFGVKRLVLPAAGQALDIWIDHFGFSKMMDSERLKFLSYTFLNFQKSTMCQKFLTGNSLKNLSYKSINLDGNSTDSEREDDQVLVQKPFSYTLRRTNGIQESDEWIPQPRHQAMRHVAAM
ncbi:increased DNA methylation 1-like [Telopea speciosissima]|uniref:increased DNA methylation 1-like n=1 Tax=Telopea speciosissima TaxID=54955 RepID=UPI001CC55F10|nr:increased DNA methylation 1-like [Telopea speciosissima]